MATFEGRFSDAAGLRVGIVVARFNDLVTAKLLSGCLDCLKRHGVDVTETSPSWMWLGNVRTAVVAQRWPPGGRCDHPEGGDPRRHAHFDVVVAEASKGIAAVARDTSVPVIFGG